MRFLDEDDDDPNHIVTDTIYDRTRESEFEVGVSSSRIWNIS